MRWLLLCLLLAGCASGPQFERPCLNFHCGPNPFNLKDVVCTCDSPHQGTFHLPIQCPNYDCSASVPPISPGEQQALLFQQWQREHPQETLIIRPITPKPATPMISLVGVTPPSPSALRDQQHQAEEFHPFKRLWQYKWWVLLISLFVAFCVWAGWDEIGKEGKWSGRDD